MNWKTELRPIGLYDPRDGEPFYADTLIRPHWYWVWRRWCLFFAIVWRVADSNPDGSNYRLSISTAWSVSEVAMGYEK